MKVSQSKSNKNSTFLVLGLFIAILYAGCSNGKISETTGTYEVDKRETRIANNQPDFDPSCLEGLKATVIFGLVSSGMKHIVQLPGWEYPLTTEQLIDRGLMVVMPNDPVTGEGELSFSKEWEPGGCYFYDDGSQHIFLMHLVECQNGFDDQQYEADIVIEDYPVPGFKCDGHSIIAEGSSEFVNTSEIRARPKYEGVTDEEIRMRNLRGQITNIVGAYSKHYPDILYSLDEYLEWIGPKNPAAFVNPYTGESMKSLPPTLVKGREYTGDSDNPIFVKNPDPQEYAGNYSEFLDEKPDGVEVIVFYFYYINKDGDLSVYGTSGWPRKLWRQGIMKGFGMEYDGD